jgi:Sec-independent protein translocase protein TatA
MFEISWGELFVVGAVGVALTGRRDLPAACHFVGSQLGRVVGLLQGARARADQFAHHNELKQLQNEFRSGLRELDQVKMELALATSTRGMIGRNLGATTASANRMKNIQPPRDIDKSVVWTSGASELSPSQYDPFNSTNVSGMAGGSSVPTPTLSSNSAISPLGVKSTTSTSMLNQKSGSLDFQVDGDDHSNLGFEGPVSASRSLEDRTQGVTNMERAVMEEEWEKQGIGFRSVAEQGEWNGSIGGTWDTNKATGSELLEYLERQCLIFDQYDQAVAEKDRALHQRMTMLKQQDQQQENSKDVDQDKTTKSNN